MNKLQFAFHPGEDLLEAIEAKGWTQRQFAELIGISSPALNAIIKGNRNITPALAVRIWAAFGTSAEVWMNLQTNYDLFVAAKEEESRISEVHQRVQELAYA